MKWVDPDVLGPAHIFDKAFVVRNTWGKVEFYRNLGKLRVIMEESMHRKNRSDPDVKANMPSIVHVEYIIDMDAATERIYRKIVKELSPVPSGAPVPGRLQHLDHYSGTGENWMNAEVMPRLMALRMLCDHPALLTYSADLL